LIATSPARIYTLSLHDALPISPTLLRAAEEHVEDVGEVGSDMAPTRGLDLAELVVSGPLLGIGKDLEREADLLEARFGLRIGLVDRKSTRLNSSHLGISYAVFC